MGFPTVRPAVNMGSTDIGTPGEPIFSVYKSRDQAIKDLLLWMDYTKFPTNIGTIDSFVEALKDRDYFQQDKKEYLEGVKKWL